jgi:hypothetical protein
MPTIETLSWAIKKAVKYIIGLFVISTVIIMGINLHTIQLAQKSIFVIFFYDIVTDILVLLVLLVI